MATVNGEKTGGRKKGSINKMTVDIRASFKSLLEKNIDQIEEDLAALRPEQRIKLIIELAKFCIPTLRSVDFVDNTPQIEDKPVFEFTRV